MTLTQWLLNAGLLVFILASNLGTRPLTAARLAMPVVLSVFAAVAFLSNAPVVGNDVALDFVGAAAGVALGIVAGMLMRVRRGAGRRLVSTAGSAYAVLWFIVIGGRVAFAESANGWAKAAITDFSISNRITGSDAWTAAFIVMALTMVAARVLTTMVRCRVLASSAGSGTMSDSGTFIPSPANRDHHVSQELTARASFERRP